MTFLERELTKAAMSNILIPSNKKYYWSSYVLKSVFEKLTGEYIPHADFKNMMYEIGFRPTARSRKEENHYYYLEVMPLPSISKYLVGRGCDLRYLEAM